MIVLRVKITEYDRSRNTCKARLLNGDVIELDPYVSCAVELSDEDYNVGKGADIVGNDYLLIEYIVYKNSIVPHKGGMIAL